MLTFNFPSTDKDCELFEALNLQPDINYTIEEVEQYLLNILTSENHNRCDRAREAYHEIMRRADKYLSSAYTRSVRPLIAEHGREFTFSLDENGNVTKLNVPVYRPSSPIPPKRAVHKLTLLLGLASAIIFLGGIVPTLIKVIYPTQPIQQGK